MSKELSVACLGAGYFAQFHYGSWARIPEVQLVGACDRDLDKARATGAPAFDALDRMLTETRPDLLDIIVPPSGHAEAIRTALAHGVRWMICQKPFCQSLAEARQLTREVADHGATLVIHENFRFQPWYRAIKAQIASGRLGDVLQMTFRLRPGDGQGPQAYLDRQPYFQTMERFLIHETGVHWVDTFRYLLGAPSAVYADLRRINPVLAGEDAGYVLFDFANGARAMFDGNRHVDHAADNTRRTMGEALVEGTQGCLSLQGDGSVHLRGYGQQDSEMVLGPDTWQGFGGDCVHALQRHVVSACLKGTSVENSAEDYLEVREIEAAIYASAAQGRKVHLPVEERQS